MPRVVSLYKDTFDVYIGRSGSAANARKVGAHTSSFIQRTGLTGLFGNPISKGHHCRECGNVHTDGGSTIPCYKKYLEQRIKLDADFRKQIPLLRGLVLGCFCAPKGGVDHTSKPYCCHGQAILEWLEGHP